MAGTALATHDVRLAERRNGGIPSVDRSSDGYESSPGARECDAVPVRVVGDHSASGREPERLTDDHGIEALSDDAIPNGIPVEVAPAW